MTVEILFDPVTVTLDGNDFILPNESEVKIFLDKVEKRINFGLAPSEQISLVVGDRFEMQRTPFYSDAEDAYLEWCLL